MAAHTPGPWWYDDWSEGVGSPAGWVCSLAQRERKGDTPFGSKRADGTLLAAACNSYDKHCGERAVECAEGDLLGELLAACKAVWQAATEQDVGDLDQFMMEGQGRLGVYLTSDELTQLKQALAHTRSSD